MGWDEVYEQLFDAPFCSEQERIVKVLYYKKYGTCGKDGLCTVCLKNGSRHYPGSPFLNVYDYDEDFYKVW